MGILSYWRFTRSWFTVVFKQVYNIALLIFCRVFLTMDFLDALKYKLISMFSSLLLLFSSWFVICRKKTYFLNPRWNIHKFLIYHYLQRICFDFGSPWVIIESKGKKSLFFFTITTGNYIKIIDMTDNLSRPVPLQAVYWGNICTKVIRFPNIC